MHLLPHHLNINKNICTYLCPYIYNIILHSCEELSNRVMYMNKTGRQEGMQTGEAFLKLVSERNVKLVLEKKKKQEQHGTLVH